MTDSEKVEKIIQLCAAFSPSIIPGLRFDASRQRQMMNAKWGAHSYDGHPAYPYDHVCDFVEAVMEIVGNPGMSNVDWRVYDELRAYGRG